MFHSKIANILLDDAPYLDGKVVSFLAERISAKIVQEFSRQYNCSCGQSLFLQANTGENINREALAQFQNDHLACKRLFQERCGSGYTYNCSCGQFLEAKTRENINPDALRQFQQIHFICEMTYRENFQEIKKELCAQCGVKLSDEKIKLTEGFCSRKCQIAYRDSD